MSWHRAWTPRGLVEGSTLPAGLRDLGQGTIWIECVLPAARSGTEQLLNLRDPDGGPDQLTITLGADGTCRLAQTRGVRVDAVSLTLPGLDLGEALVVHYDWSLKDRAGHLALWAPDSGRLAITDRHAPLPLATSLFRPSRLGAEALSPNALFAALSDEVECCGPMPTLGEESLLHGLRGPVRVSDLKPGSLLRAGDGSVSQVRWVGQRSLPGLGRFSPIMIRAPFHGQVQNLTVASDQRIALDGSDVEYLFGEERVLARAGDLVDGRGVIALPPRLMQTYWHVLLDEAGLLTVGQSGEMLGLEAGCLTEAPALRPNSILRDMPTELMPVTTEFDCPVLKPYEAVTLSAMAL